MGNMYKKIGEDRTCTCRDMSRTDRQTHTHTHRDRHSHYNNSPPYQRQSNYTWCVTFLQKSWTAQLLSKACLAEFIRKSATECDARPTVAFPTKQQWCAGEWLTCPSEDAEKHSVLVTDPRLPSQSQLSYFCKAPSVMHLWSRFSY